MSWTRKPRTPEERQQEIARLEAVRDRLLARAPQSFTMRRFVITAMFAVFLLAIVDVLVFHPEHADWRLLLFGLAFGGILLNEIRKLWWQPPTTGDRWALSDRLGYEGDSPRDLQARIDRLRAEDD